MFCRLIAVVFLLAPLLVAGSRPATEEHVELHARIPLGVQSFFVRPARRNLYVFSTALSPHFEGWRVVVNDGHKAMLGTDGARVDYWPDTVQFRVTASLLDDDLQDVDRSFLDLDSDTNLNTYLLGLRFRVKVFHGLDVTEIQPDGVEMMGVPADLSYDERIYRASFSFPHPVPVDDRIVLEVLDPQGERLCKFHLEY